MANELMHEMNVDAGEILAEPEVFRAVLATKLQLTRALNEHCHEIVGCDAGLIAAQKLGAFGCFLGLLMGEIAIDRSEEEFRRYPNPAEWFDAVIWENTTTGRGVSLREGVSLYRKGATPADLADAIGGYWEAQRCYLEHCRTFAGSPRPLRIQRFEDETFTPYGRSLALADDQVFREVLKDERFYTGGRVVVGEGQTWELGRLVTDKRQGGSYYAVQCDSHRKTEEILVPDRDCILTVDRYREPERDDDGRLTLPCFEGEVFLLRGGHPVVINKGISHTAPTRFGYGGALTTPVLFQRGTTVGEHRDIELVRFREHRLFLQI